MAETGKQEVKGLLARAGWQLEYGSAFVIARRSTDQRGQDLVEMELEIVEQLGKRLEEIRAQVTAVARTARGQELLGQRVVIPFVGIGERTLDDGCGRVIRSMISGKLAAFSEGQLTVSHVETRDDKRIEETTRCAFDEGIIVVGSGDQPDRGSFASIRNEKMRGALERGQKIGLTLEHDAGLVIAKWNVAPGDQSAADELLRELGPPRGELFSFLEGRARGAAGSEFVGSQIFVRSFGSIGVIKGIDLDGTLEVTYLDKNLGSSLTCRCNGSDSLIIGSPEADRASSAEPESAAPKNWLRRAFGS